MELTSMARALCRLSAVATAPYIALHATKHIAKGTTMNTDEAMAYHYMSEEFAAHGTVNHSQDEYVSKDGQTHIQSDEAFFAIFRRGVMGSFHSISEQALAEVFERVCVKVE